MVSSNVKAASTSDQSVAFASGGSRGSALKTRVFDGTVAGQILPQVKVGASGSNASSTALLYKQNETIDLGAGVRFVFKGFGINQQDMTFRLQVKDSSSKHHDLLYTGDIKAGDTPSKGEIQAFLRKRLTPQGMLIVPNSAKIKRPVGKLDILQPSRSFDGGTGIAGTVNGMMRQSNNAATDAVNIGVFGWNWGQDRVRGGARSIENTTSQLIKNPLATLNQGRLYIQGQLQDGYTSIVRELMRPPLLDTLGMKPVRRHSSTDNLSEAGQGAALIVRVVYRYGRHRLQAAHKQYAQDSITYGKENAAGGVFASFAPEMFVVKDLSAGLLKMGLNAAERKALQISLKQVAKSPAGAASFENKAFHILKTRDGIVSVRNKATGEIVHFKVPKTGTQPAAPPIDRRGKPSPVSMKPAPNIQSLPEAYTIPARYSSQGREIVIMRTKNQVTAEIISTSSVARITIPQHVGLKADAILAYVNAVLPTHGAKGAGGTAGTTRANERNRQLGAKQPAMTVTQDDPNHNLGGGAVKDQPPKMVKNVKKPALTRKYFVNSEGNFQFQASDLKITVQKPPQSSLKHHPMTVATPENNTAIAITTDFHGMNIRAKNMLDGLIKELRQSPEPIKILVVNGDLINKGTDSASVLANLRKTIKNNPDIRFKLIAGNHEREYGGPVFLRGNVPLDDAYMEHVRDLLLPQGSDKEGKGLALTALSYAKKYGKGESEFGRRLRNPPDVKDLLKKLTRAEGRRIESEIYVAKQHVEEARRWYQSFQDTMMRLVPKEDILLIKNMREKYQNGNIFIAHTLDAGKDTLKQTGSDLRLPRFVVQMQNYEAAGQFNRDFGGFYPIVGHTMVEKPIVTYDQGAAIDHASFRRNRLAGMVITPNSVRMAFSGLNGFRSETLEQAMEYGDIVDSYRKTKVIPNR
jgi:Calcineurin-like phosphoesterase